jgi:hypothetical protein
VPRPTAQSFGRTPERTRYTLNPACKNRVWEQFRVRSVIDIWKEQCNPENPGWFSNFFHRRLPDRQTEEAMTKLENFLDRETVSEGASFTVQDVDLNIILTYPIEAISKALELKVVSS